MYVYITASKNFLLKFNYVDHIHYMCRKLLDHSSIVAPYTMQHTEKFFQWWHWENIVTKFPCLLRINNKTNLLYAIILLGGMGKTTLMYFILFQDTKLWYRNQVPMFYCYIMDWNNCFEFSRKNGRHQEDVLIDDSPRQLDSFMISYDNYSSLVFFII